MACRVSGYRLTDRNAPSQDGRPIRAGSSGIIAEGIGRYEELGVRYLIVSFLPVYKVSDTADDTMGNMEKLANEVRPNE